MKRLLWVVVMLLVVFAPCSYADSISIFNIAQVTGYMSPNYGSGDNIFFIFTGPGTSIEAIGGMACFEWCSGNLIPDLNSVYIGETFVNQPFGSVKIGGTTYDPASVGYDCCFFSSGSLNGSVTLFAGQGDTYKEIMLTLPQGGGWDLTFEGDSLNGYWFTSGEFTAGSPYAPIPEPGTLGLMATGLAGIVGVIRRKRLIWRRRRTETTFSTPYC